MNTQDTTRVNREHKDRLFRFIFKQKKELLSHQCGTQFETHGEMPKIV